jgi:hypothetical protein
MNKPNAAEVFDFTTSFRATLDRFEHLRASSRADYQRTKEKREELVAKAQAEKSRIASQGQD